MYNSAEDIVPIDPSVADVVLTTEVYALRASAAGIIKVLTRAGNAVSMNFLAGETRMVCTGVIFKSGTTATGIEGLVSGWAVAPNVVPSDSSIIVGDVTEGTPDVAPAADGTDAPGAGDSAP